MTIFYIYIYIYLFIFRTELKKRNSNPTLEAIILLKKSTLTISASFVISQTHEKANLEKNIEFNYTHILIIISHDSSFQNII